MEISCPSCHAKFPWEASSTTPPRYCVYCGAELSGASKGSLSIDIDSRELLLEAPPRADQIQFTVGPYQVLDSLGKGGMGEVFLAYDTSCGRRIAIKRIRPDLSSHSQLHHRFLKEAQITSQLTHPAIIPIYAIQKEQDLAYYTMPFVEGKTLKQILVDAKIQEREGLKADHLSGIPALVRILLSVCQAVAYAHSKDVLHRDLKPTNIIVGRYGEVLILDWGLAKRAKQAPDLDEQGEEVEQEEKVVQQELTRIGRVVGTVAYMAPERALGKPANFQTDIYALGIILYQILTLRHPFVRKTLKEFRQNMAKEVLMPPAQVAPYRDVPPVLSRITLKCLNPNPEERYGSVDALIHDLESYIEGRSEWFQAAKLDINRKADWEFQENVLLAEHIAITRGTDILDWVSLMISKSSFSDNTKIEARVTIGEEGNGLGFLLSVPEASERVHLNNGYCLWIGSDIHKTTKLLRSAVEVVYTPEIFLERHKWYDIRIEKIDHHIHFYLNHVLQFSYVSHLPLSGTHIGLLARDADFTIEDFTIFLGSQNIKVNCLAVPDAFLAHKSYASALTEYRRIAYAFPGTAEGREAMFRAGITLLEEVRTCSNPEERQRKADAALDEFGNLHGTAGAPLEYLGKALVYQELRQFDEEVKCFELAYRRYRGHPLLHILHEQQLHRMHDTSREERIIAYEFMLLAIRYLPARIVHSKAGTLFGRLKKYWEPLYFIDDKNSAQSAWEESQTFAIQLAFWLAKSHVLEEIIDEEVARDPPSSQLLGNALFALLELGKTSLVREKIKTLGEGLNPALQRSLEVALDGEVALLLEHPSTELSDYRTVRYLIQQALWQQQPERVHLLAALLKKRGLSPEHTLQIDCLDIWALLWERNWGAAGELLHGYPLMQLIQETTPLHFLYGCWLYVTEGREIASVHFSSVLEVVYPPSWALFSHFIHGKSTAKQRWLLRAFSWEKRQLYWQCALFYHCLGDAVKEAHYLKNNHYYFQG
jgi:serine/threonine protein kinase